MIRGPGSGTKPGAKTARGLARRQRLVIWLRRNDWGMYGVGLAAAVLSFDQLWRLALVCGWPPSIAWLLAVILDVYAINATRRWLRAGVDAQLRRWAAVLVWGCVGLSMAGNTVEHALSMGYLAMGDGRPDWWIVVIVGAVPTIMLGSLIHLEAMSRSVRLAPGETDTEDDEQKAGRSKRARLVAVLEATPPPATESNYKVAQRLGPSVGLNVQSATRYVRLWRSARGEVVRLGANEEAVS
jgi:hypothetical protein